MKKIRTLCFAAGAAICLGTSSANAALITTAAPLAPSTVIDFQQFTSVALANAVPVQVSAVAGEDVEIFGLGSGDGFVGPMSHNLAGNGSWNSTVDPNFRGASLPVSSALAFKIDGTVTAGGRCKYFL